MAQPVALGDRNEAFEHDQHAGRDLPGFVQPLTVRVFAQRAVTPQPIDLLRLQLGKRLLVARSVGGVEQIGHAFALEVIKAGPL